MNRTSEHGDHQGSAENLRDSIVLNLDPVRLGGNQRGRMTSSLVDG